MLRHYTTDTECEVRVSYYREKAWGEGWSLHQAKITEQVSYPGFNDFIQQFFDKGRYPEPQTHKLQTYGWNPLWFQESQNRSGKWGRWRAGAHSDHQITVFYADLDNNHPFEKQVTMAEVERVLAKPWGSSTSSTRRSRTRPPSTRSGL